MNRNNMSYKLTVYFDGLCPLCSREINHYKNNPKSNRIRWIDITDPHFNAQEEGLDPKEVHRSLHSKNENGRILQGLDSFIAIWEALESYRPLIALARTPLIHPVLKGFYHAFTWVRPYLPRRARNECKDHSCFIDKTKR